MKKKILLITACILLICGCTSKEEKQKYEESLKNRPIVSMTIKDYGTIKMELYPDVAYNTVANFISLIEDGFYDNNTIHRVQKDFVIQGGDPTGTGTEGPGYTIIGEFVLNGFTNNLSHTEGVISMARGQDYNSAGSQFFIVLSDNYTSALDNKYTGFGKVIEGMDIAHKIEKDAKEFKNEEMGVLKNNLTIEKTTVETNGYIYKLTKYNA